MCEHAEGRLISNHCYIAVSIRSLSPLNPILCIIIIIIKTLFITRRFVEVSCKGAKN